MRIRAQVYVALLMFAPELRDCRLTVVGAIHDAQCVLGQGQGHELIGNITGNVGSVPLAARMH